MLSPPRYATPRRPDRPTTGAHVALVAALLGVDLQPWQRHVVDVAGELVADDETGELIHAYSEIRVGVGRRAGKSLLILARLVATVVADRRRFAYYTAQNGKAAAERFRNDWIPLVTVAPMLGPRLKPRLTNGTETLTDTHGASYLRIFSPVPTALHGDAGDLIVFDETFAHTAERGAELEVAAFPLMATRPGAQVWKLSAAGDVDSTWWNADIESGRVAALADRGRGVCHVEWCADAPGVDLDDPAEWIRSHPGVRHPGNPTGVISLDFLHGEHNRDAGQFRRAYLNVTDRTGTTSAVIDVDAWNLLDLDGDVDRAAGITLGVDVAPEQAHTSIVACAVVDGVAHVELVDRRAGHTWVVDRVVELVDRYRIVTVGVDVGGQSPTAVLDRALTLAGIPLHRLDLAAITAASADMLAAIRAATIRHVAHPDLDAAAAGARRRYIGDGAWTFGRAAAGTVDVSPLIAATFARWVHPQVIGPAYAAIG